MHEKSITSFNVQDGTVKRKRVPLINKKFIISLVIIIIVIGAISLAYYFGAFHKNDNEEKLAPPNPTKPLPPSAAPLHIFKKAAVCSDGPQCAKIGREILAKNGSAVDATIATMFCTGLIAMQSMGIGGGFVMTIYSKEENKAYFLNARESAPLNSNTTMFGSDPKKSKEGALAVGVPGELKGYWMAHQKFGKLPWKDLVQPSVDICEEGYTMSPYLHEAVMIQKKLIPDDVNLREWFMDGEKFKPIGSLVKPLKLCETLKVIAEKGANDFYNGTIAKKFAEDVQNMGGIITEEDLKNYTAKWVKPVEIPLEGEEVLYTAPLPGSGYILGFILNILNGYGFNSSSIDGLENTVLTYHRIIEAFKYAYAKRTELGDTDFIDINELLANLTSVEYANEIRMKIHDNSTSTKVEDYGALFYGNGEDHGTAHISVLAENGDAVSVTSTLNIYLGAAVTSNQTGIVLNSVMDDFANKEYISYFGLPGSPNNAIAPGKRPLSSMSPSIIVDKNGDVKLVIGAAGGTRIPSAISLAIMRILWFGQNVKEAVDAPRFHHQIHPMRVEYEYGTLQQIVEGLEKIGHKMVRYRDRGSVICALLKEAERIIGNADNRRNMNVFGID